MKKLLTIVFIVLLNTIAFSQNKFVVGVEGNYYSPLGTLSSWFEPTSGGSIEFGQDVSEAWTWTGKFQYYKFNKGNKDEFFLNSVVEVGDEKQTFKIPLPDLEVELEIFGLSANANYHFIQNDYVYSDMQFGFGIYRWFSTRGEYYDSLYVDTTAAGGRKLAEVLEVPQIKQKDWSGGFDFGLEVGTHIFKPVSFYAGANYKVVIGEIWQALAINMENISSFQMLNIRLGVRYKF
jgi:hypothetical protein